MSIYLLYLVLSMDEYRLWIVDKYYRLSIWFYPWMNKGSIYLLYLVLSMVERYSPVALCISSQSNLGTSCQIFLQVYIRVESLDTLYFQVYISVGTLELWNFGTVFKCKSLGTVNQVCVKEGTMELIYCQLCIKVGTMELYIVSYVLK